jgi:molecular chaperone DnaK
MTAGSKFEEVIGQNTTVPTASTKVFTTSRDNQTAVKILVMQGESLNATENELLGEFILTGLRQAPRGEVEIEVTFQIDTDGIVSVSAKDLENGKAQSIQVTASSGLTRDEIDTMMENAKDYLVERRSNEEFERLKQQAETLCAELERTLPEVERMVGNSEFGRDALAKARSAISQAKTAASGQDAGALATQLASLERTQRMFRGVVSHR